MIQTQENVEKPHFGPDLCPLDPNSQKYFLGVLPLLVVRHCSKLSFYPI